MTQLTVLIACEESQAECLAFRELGHEAYSCDIQPCRPSGHPEWHIHGDVLPLLDGLADFVTQDNTPHHIEQWDLIIAHPPCTYLCVCGSYWLWYLDRKNGCHFDKLNSPNPERMAKLKQAREFFYRCYRAKADYVAVENPKPMRLAQLPPPDCYIQPSWFGVKWTKKTFYWLRNLPPILPTIEHPSPKSFVNASRGKYRSRTFPEVARALAEQWSKYVIEDLERRNLEKLRTILEPTLSIGSNTFDQP